MIAGASRLALRALAARSIATTAVTIGVPKESFYNEKRVAHTPKSVSQLVDLGFKVVVERDAGVQAEYTNEAYEAAGATVLDTKEEVFASDMVMKIRRPEADEIAMMKEGGTLLSLVQPDIFTETMEQLGEKKATVLALDKIPRTSRAQAFDVLSSQANVSGYRAVVEATHHLGRFMPGQMTAAGKVPPSKMLVIGGGVAGLAAIQLGSNLGAVVRGFDTRPEVKEQVESIGGKFLELKGFELETGVGGYAKTMSPEFIAAEMDLFAQQCEEVDIVVTTALIPGKRAPILITKEMVDSMTPGSVIVDLAAENGGNCEYTKKDEVVVTPNGVKVLGFTDLPSRLPVQASQLIATNITKFTKDMVKDGEFIIDHDVYEQRGALVMENGVRLEPPPVPAGPVRPAKKEPVVEEPKKELSPFAKTLRSAGALAGVLGTVMAAGAGMNDAAMATVLATTTLSGVIGYNLVWGV
jgi:NAD(P) transhydrogenase alpha subunit